MVLRIEAGGATKGDGKKTARRLAAVAYLFITRATRACACYATIEMRFRVTVRTSGGEETRTIDAPSRFAVYEQVQKDGGTVVGLTESNATKLSSLLHATLGTGVKNAEVIRMAKNLSAMLSAGLSLSRSLAVIQRQSGKRKMAEVTAHLAQTVEKGSSFHEALAQYPKVFPPLFISMAQAGEESGSLAEALNTVGIQMEHTSELIRKVKGAMIYPSIVISAVIIIAILMLMYVVPVLTKTFVSLHVKVPLATRVIVAISNMLINNVALTLLVLVGVVGGGIAFIRSARGSALVLRASLLMPAIGELVRETYAARAARTLSSLLSAGVPVLEALSITKAVVHAPLFANIIEEAETGVRKGEPLSSAFAAHPNVYPLLMSDMLSVGEETGKVAQMLGQIAEFYENDVAEKTKDLSTIIEPLLMLFIGTMVGIFAVAMIAPIYQLSSAF